MRVSPSSDFFFVSVPFSLPWLRWCQVTGSRKGHVVSPLCCSSSSWGHDIFRCWRLCKYASRSCLSVLSVGPVALPSWFSLTQLSLVGDFLHLGRACNPSLCCGGTASCQGDRILPKYRGEFWSPCMVNWLQKCQLGKQIPRTDFGNHPAPGWFTGFGCAPGWCGVAWTIFFFFSLELKKEIGAAFLYQSGPRRETDGWHSQRGCLIQESLMKGLLEDGTS